MACPQPIDSATCSLIVYYSRAVPLSLGTCLRQCCSFIDNGIDRDLLGDTSTNRYVVCDDNEDIIGATAAFNECVGERRKANTYRCNNKKVAEIKCQK